MNLICLKNLAKKASVGLCFSISAAVASAESVRIELQADSSGPVINKHIFGQFAEHLGRGIYEGVWVGPESEIPNTRGIRNDVLAALQEIKVPNVRWPGGCFADEYHWRDGIGPMEERKQRLNASWAGTIEPNTFGTHEFFDFIELLGAEAFVSANVGSGTVQEAADWLEYLTARNSSLAELREQNGRKEPFKVTFWGIGNESWGCGGPFTAEEYLTKLKRYSNFSTNYNGEWPVQHVAVGPDGDGYSEYTPVIMEAWANKSWAWDIQALSLHRYTRNGWPPNIKADGFDEKEYAAVLAEAMGVGEFIARNKKIMDKYDPEVKVSILVDEWGGWYAPAEGSADGSLEQGNSIRDALISAIHFYHFIEHADRVHGANVAQMVNVLQAMILTRQEDMILTPSYHAFRLFAPFQNAQRLDLNYKKGQYKQGEYKLPAILANAARTQDGSIIIAVTNLHASEPQNIELLIPGMPLKHVSVESLGADKFNIGNSFTSPDRVRTSMLVHSSEGDQLVFSAPAHSVSLVTIPVQK